MRKTIALCVSLAVLVAFMAPAAFGAVVGSRHDMADAGNTRVTLQNLNTFGTCSACHLPHGAGADRLFPSTVGGAGGFFGGLCGSCHSNAIIAGDVDLNFNVTVLAGHGLDIGVLSANGDHETVDTANVGGTALQYRDITESPRPTPVDEIECLSCHDVHNQNGFRPFMAVDLDDLCEACHSNRVNGAIGTTGFANNAGTSGSTHPSSGSFLGDVSGIASPGTDSPFVASWGTEFTANADDATAGSTWGDAVWDSGLQLENQAAAGAGSVDCISCHNVHWDEDDGVTPANGTAYLGITADGAGGPANLFCEYCHQGGAVSAGGFWWNPGAVGTFSHPNDDVGSTAVDSTTFTSMPFGQFATTSARTGTGASGLVCTGCHGVHPGDSTAPETESNSPILLNYDETTFSDVCDACHTGSTAFQHHPTGGTYATLGNNANGITCAGGDLAPGVNQCHGTAGANVAHNRTEALSAPYGATRICGETEQCIACHTNNPSTFTPAGGGYTADGLASHWVNETWVASGMGDNSAMCNANAGIRYAGGGCSDGSATDVWAGSTLASLFPAADPDCLICESCHRLVVNNLNSGDGTTNMLVEVSGMAIDTIAESAAAQTTADYDAAPYICTGCHLVPGGTHPLLEADGTVFPIGGGSAGFGYTTTASNVNCESCHSPHDAETTSGSYILDASGSAYGAGAGMDVEPAIDYTSFCAVCHNTYQ